MANMSYCMFENTVNDMEDVLARMEEANTIGDLKLNEYELIAFRRLWSVARNILGEHERLLNNTEADAEEDLSDCCYED